MPSNARIERIHGPTELDDGNRVLTDHVQRGSRPGQIRRWSELGTCLHSKPGVSEGT